MLDIPTVGKHLHAALYHITIAHHHKMASNTPACIRSMKHTREKAKDVLVDLNRMIKNEINTLGVT